jgi:hypothetical protein
MFIIFATGNKILTLRLFIIFQNLRNGVIPQNFLFGLRSWPKESLCGIPFGFCWQGTKWDSGQNRIFPPEGGKKRFFRNDESY